jgi:signal transduction histidine kinase
MVATAITTMVALAFAVPLGSLARTLAIERSLHEAEVGARALAPVLAAIEDPEELAAAVQLTSASVPGPLTVLLADGQVLGAPAARDAHVDAAALGEASTRRTDDGWRVLVPVVHGQDTAVVQVLVPKDTAEAGVMRVWLVLAALALVLVAGAVVVADRLGRSTVAAVRALETTAEQLGGGDLEARADVHDPPEVAAVAGALHTLAERVRRLLAAEREAAADLSHRVRTPLMALRLDVEALPPSSQADRLTDDLDALERAVDAVIRDARRSAEDRLPAAVDVVALLRERAAFWSVLAEDQGRPFEIRLPDERLVVLGQQDELSSAVDALLGNVFAHTPEGTGLALRVTTSSAGCEIVVEDDGPGITAALGLERGVSGGGSTGLGLDIARRTASSIGGQLAIDRSPTGGARIVMRLPIGEGEDLGRT